jgi:hypothetical protein
MEFRLLGGSGFKVPALSLGSGTFGGGNDFFRAWGDIDVKGAVRLVDICLRRRCLDRSQRQAGRGEKPSAGRGARLDRRWAFLPDLPQAECPQSLL